MVGVLLLGRQTPFGTALAERLERVGIDTDSDDGIRISCWDGSESPSSDLLIRPSSAPEPLAEHTCTLVIHDLYLPSGVGDWGPTDIVDRLEWLDAGAEGEPPAGSPRHYVHIRDAVDAVAALLKAMPSGRLDMCGRRCWSHQATCEELGMLWARFQAAVDHSFQIEHLEVFEPKTEPAERVERPDLAPLHSALEDAGTMGWHPLVPFRVGLMECIAEHIEGE